MIDLVSVDGVNFTQKNTLPEVRLSLNTQFIFIENGFDNIPLTPNTPDLTWKASSIASLEKELKEAEKGEETDKIWACARAFLSTLLIASAILFIANPWVSVPLGIAAVILAVVSGVKAYQATKHSIEGRSGGLFGPGIGFVLVGVAPLSPILPWYEMSNRIPNLKEVIQEKKDEIDAAKEKYASAVEGYTRDLSEYINTIDYSRLERRLTEVLNGLSAMSAESKAALSAGQSDSIEARKRNYTTALKELRAAVTKYGSLTDYQ